MHRSTKSVVMAAFPWISTTNRLCCRTQSSHARLFYGHLELKLCRKKRRENKYLRSLVEIKLRASHITEGYILYIIILTVAL